MSTRVKITNEIGATPGNSINVEVLRNGVGIATKKLAPGESFEQNITADESFSVTEVAPTT